MMQQSIELICQFVEEPELVSFIQKLDEKSLLKLINHIGVEDAGELVAIATTDQLTCMFDNVLWKSEKSGTSIMFDPEQFVLWIEIMHEVSDKAVFKQVISMDEDLLTLGLAKNLLVVDFEMLSLRMANSNRLPEDDLLDKILDSSFILEWGEYLIISSRTSGWDTIVSVLTDLDQSDHVFVHHLLERICHVTTEYIEDNGGLYNVLKSEDMLEVDVAADREDRREKQGFVASQTAAAFLELARITPIEEIKRQQENDYLSRSYFTSYDEGQFLREKYCHNEQLQLKRIAQQFPEVYEQLLEANIITSGKQSLLPDSENGRASNTILHSALQALKVADESKFTHCLVELHFLANVLVSGDYSDGYRLRHIEAAGKVMELCQEGIIHYVGKDLSDSFSNTSSIVSLIQHKSLVKMFRIGWNLQSNKTVP